MTWAYATKRTPRSLIHAVAKCRDCEWSNTAYMQAAREASKHVRLTGHTVSVEQGIVYTVRKA